MSRAAFNAVLCKADRDAYQIVKRAVQETMPKGWEMILAVGWGLTVYDDKRQTVIGTYEDAPSRLPKGFRKACLMAADYVEAFGYANQRIGGRA